MTQLPTATDTDLKDNIQAAVGDLSGQSYVNDQRTDQDLTVDDTVIGPVTVERADAIVIAVNETTGGTLDVNVDWLDGSGNIFQSETPTNLGLDDVTEDWARLVRKGPQVKVTVSNASSATSANIHVDSET